MATRAHSRFCWVSPSHAIKYMENLKEEILWSRFQIVGFPESIMTNLTTRQLSMDWIVQAISYRAGGRSQDPKSRKIKGKSRAKCSRVPTKMTPLTTSIVQHTMLRLGKIIPPCLEDCSQSIHSWRIHLSRSDQGSHTVRSYVLLLILYRKYVNKIVKNLLIDNFSGAKKLFLIQLREIIL